MNTQAITLPIYLSICLVYPPMCHALAQFIGGLAIRLYSEVGCFWLFVFGLISSVIPPIVHPKFHSIQALADFNANYMPHMSEMVAPPVAQWFYLWARSQRPLPRRAALHPGGRYVSRRVQPSLLRVPLHAPHQRHGALPRPGRRAAQGAVRSRFGRVLVRRGASKTLFQPEPRRDGRNERMSSSSNKSNRSKEVHKDARTC